MTITSSGESTIGQWSSRISENSANFNLRMSLVISTFPGDSVCLGGEQVIKYIF